MGVGGRRLYPRINCVPLAAVPRDLRGAQQPVAFSADELLVFIQLLQIHVHLPGSFQLGDELHLLVEVHDALGFEEEVLESHGELRHRVERQLYPAQRIGGHNVPGQLLGGNFRCGTIRCGRRPAGQQQTCFAGNPLCSWGGGFLFQLADLRYLTDFRGAQLNIRLGGHVIIPSAVRPSG